MVSKEKLTDLIKQVAKQLSGDFENIEGKLIPHHTIKGTGYGYYLSYTDRNFVKIPRGIEVFILAEDFDHLGRTMVYTYTHEIILVLPEELDYIGFQ